MGYSQLYQLKENTLSNGLIAHYPFNGNANDISGNNYHGTVVGTTPTTNRFGIVNSAYSFDGVNNYIQVLRNWSIINSNFSISIWFNKLNQATTSSLFIFQNYPYTVYDFRIYIINTIRILRNH